LLTAEREQLPGEVARTFDRVEDGVDVRVSFVRQLLAEELGVAADDGEDVVEVVSDPTGEPVTSSMTAIDKSVAAEWLKLMWA
jgi:hypothetical protein